MIYCTCGHFLVESESRRKLNKLRLDALSIPHYVIKKERPHGARHGRTEALEEYHVAWNAWERCCKKVATGGSRSTRVDPKLFGKPSDFSGDRREWRHFEWVFRNWFGFTCGAGRSGPGSQRDGQSAVHESGHGVQERGSGCCENGDSQAWLRELAQIV